MNEAAEVDRVCLPFDFFGKCRRCKCVHDVRELVEVFLKMSKFKDADPCRYATMFLDDLPWFEL